VLNLNKEKTLYSPTVWLILTWKIVRI